jgi:hypothetical protein
MGDGSCLTPAIAPKWLGPSDGKRTVVHSEGSRYSMISSARARIAGGTVSPSALAVFRLTTSSREGQPTPGTAGIARGPNVSLLAVFCRQGQPALPSRHVLYSDRSKRRTNRGRETMRDDPCTAANRDKEGQKVTIPPRRKATADTRSPPSKPTISGTFWAGQKTAPDVPQPQGIVGARQRTDD